MRSLIATRDGLWLVAPSVQTRALSHGNTLDQETSDAPHNATPNPRRMLLSSIWCEPLDQISPQGTTALFARPHAVHERRWLSWSLKAMLRVAEEAPRPSVLGGLAGARLWWIRCGTKGESERSDNFRFKANTSQRQRTGIRRPAARSGSPLKRHHCLVFRCMARAPSRHLPDLIMRVPPGRPPTLDMLVFMTSVRLALRRGHGPRRPDRARNPRAGASSDAGVFAP